MFTDSLHVLRRCIREQNFHAFSDLAKISVIIEEYDETMSSRHGTLD
jgi:hypothetical protein